MTPEVSNALSISKTKYYERLPIKLNDPQTASKTYWSILKTFVNGTKISVIPPLLANNNLITDFKLKANLLNDFFNQKCTTVNNPVKRSVLKTCVLKLRKDFILLKFAMTILIGLSSRWTQIRLTVMMEYQFVC